jgi:hypothetical protein
MKGINTQPRTHELQILWLTVLLPPIVWALQMEINYVLIRRACAAERSTSLLVTSLAALVLIVLSAIVAWPYSWRLRPESRPTEFVGLLGLLSSGMFTVAILAQGLAAILLHPCQL